MVSEIDDGVLAEATKNVTAIYKAQGGNAKAAKEPSVQKQLLVALKNRYLAKKRAS